MGKMDPSENILILMPGFTNWANEYFSDQMYVVLGNFDLARAVRALEENLALNITSY